MRLNRLKLASQNHPEETLKTSNCELLETYLDYGGIRRAILATAPDVGYWAALSEALRQDLSHDRGVQSMAAQYGDRFEGREARTPWLNHELHARFG